MCYKTLVSWSLVEFAHLFIVFYSTHDGSVNHSSQLHAEWVDAHVGVHVISSDQCSQLFVGGLHGLYGVLYGAQFLLENMRKLLITCQHCHFKCNEDVTIAVVIKQLRRTIAMVISLFHLYFRTSYHFTLRYFHFFQGLMNSINWPGLHVWVFIVQLVEYCSMNAEATGSNPVEAPKIFFFSPDYFAIA